MFEVVEVAKVKTVMVKSVFGQRSGRVDGQERLRSGGQERQIRRIQIEMTVKPGLEAESTGSKR